MSNELEQQMKELLAGASLDEVMPDFNKETLWATVAAKIPLPEKKKRIIVLSWMTKIAAILLLGITIIAGIYFAGTNNAANEKITAFRPIKSASQNVQQMATPEQSVSYKPGKRIVKTAKRVLPVQSIIKPKTIGTSALAIDVKTEAPRAVAPAATNTTVAVASPKKVTHYLDIDDDVPVATASMAVVHHSFIQLKLNKPAPSQQALRQKTFKESVALALAK